MKAAKQIVSPEPVSQSGGRARFQTEAAGEHATKWEKALIVICVIAGFALAIYVDTILR